MHVGLYKNRNYSTLLDENTFLDFLLPAMDDMHKKHGKGSRDNNYNKEYKEVISHQLEINKEKL